MPSAKDNPIVDEAISLIFAFKDIASSLFTNRSSYNASIMSLSLCSIHFSTIA